MEEHEPYSFDLNLDFLESTTDNTKPSHITQVFQQPDQSQINSIYDIESLATRIATVNDMTIQFNTVKDENSSLHKQMQELSESAMSIRSMYEQEKTERLELSKLYEELKQKYQHTESQLTNKTLHFEQIQSRLELESEDKKPIPFNDLALRYHRLALHLEEEKQLPSKDKVTLQQIKDYVESKKLTPLAPCKKKTHTKSVKTQDFCMQFNTKVESQSQEIQCSVGLIEDEFKDTCSQGTQYSWYTTTRGTNTPALNNPKADMKSQGTQYISSTTTRGTSTSTFIKTQSIGTNFPEPAPPVSIEDIFNEMIFDVAPLSPMLASPPEAAELKEEIVELKSTGTCTEIKNVRKPIDYVAANIKHSDSRPPSRNSGSSNLYDRVKNEIPMMGMPTMNPFAGLGLSMHNNVAELWNMLGNTIFALLHQNSGANVPPMMPMNMSIINDRSRNVSGRSRAPSEQRRHCEAHMSNDYFDQEYPREYPTATRNAATSPILSQESLHEDNSTLPFMPTARNLNQPVELQKIVLNKNFSSAEPVVSSSKKTSQVDEILQLFPEYSDSFRKRKAIKKLLQADSKRKKPKKKLDSSSSSSSLSTSTQFTPKSAVDRKQLPRLETNWKTEIFGESDSDTNTCFNDIPLEEKPHSELISNQIVQPSNEAHDCWPTKFNRTKMKPDIEEEFLGFDEEASFPSASSSNKVFDKQRQEPRPNIQNNVSSCCAISSFTTNIEPKQEESLPALPSNPKRKRRTKKSAANETNKICKLESCVPPQPEKAPIDSKKPMHTMKTAKGKGSVILPILSPTTISSSVKKPLRSLSLNKAKTIKKEPKQVPMPSTNRIIQPPKDPPTFVKPDWMNRIRDPQQEEENLSIQVSTNNNRPMVMKVENPPYSIFEDIKTCLSNQLVAPVLQDVKSCLTATQKENEIKPFLSQPGQENVQPNATPNDYAVVLNDNTLSANPATGPEHCSEPSKSHITILNDQWISEPNDVKATKQESVCPIEEDDSRFDLENMPICFLDEEKDVLPNPEQPMEDEMEYEANQKPFESPQSVNTLPGFQEIRQGLKTNTVQCLGSSRKQQELPFGSVPVSRLPVIVPATPSFVQKQMTIETVGDCKPLVSNQNSFLLLNHQKQVNSSLMLFASDQSQHSSIFGDENRSTAPHNIQTPLTDHNYHTVVPVPSTSLKKEQTNSENSSGSEHDLAIDYPTSPRPDNTSELDLSAILKTPEQTKTTVGMVQFKTPESCPTKNNHLIAKVITDSTEKLVDNFISNDVKPSSTFQLFLDRILDDVAPPTSPVSALASSEKPSNSEAESSCDESSTPKKYKRKAPATAALAVKRSERIKTMKIEAESLVSHSLCAMSIGNIELGKYTTKKTEQKTIVEPKREEKPQKAMGFLQEATDDESELMIDEGGELDDDAPQIETIRRYPMEEFKAEVPQENDPSACATTDDYESDEDEKPLSFLVASRNSSLTYHSESPASPPPSEQLPIETHSIRELFDDGEVCAKSNSNQHHNTIVSHLIKNYNRQHHELLTKTQKRDDNLLKQLQSNIQQYLNGICLVMDTIRFISSVIKLTTDDRIISKALVNVLKDTPTPAAEITEPTPATYLSQTHRKLLTLIAPLCHHYPNFHRSLQLTLEQSMFTFAKEIIPVEVLINLTQFYLAVINNPSAVAAAGATNPARLFICKCLYFFNQKAIPMIYHTLCVYPTVLPQKSDATYDRSDILISTIQSILMSTYYDPEKSDLMTKQILIKLKVFYSYESFKPPRDEVIENMMAKIRAGRLKNVSYALSVICKRMEQSQTEKFILNERLLPLANEFYQGLQQKATNAEQIACVLECISFVIRPFDLCTDVTPYLNLFGRFLNAATENKVIQEAAVAAILRTARFGYVQCFNAIYNFKPTYDLSESLKLMLRSFVYKKTKAFLLSLEQQAKELVAT